jgi:hypothetical protein
MEAVAATTPGIMKLMINCDCTLGLDFDDLPWAEIQKQCHLGHVLKL